jgi:CHAT domain-containing protein/tetratricopeptide (TPR) repeat protein
VRQKARRAIAAIAVAAALALAPVAPARAAPATPAELQSRVIANLAAGKVGAAVKGADSLAAAMRARYKDKPLSEAGFLDTLTLRFINAGATEGLEAARRYASRALSLRERILGPENLEVASNLNMLALVDSFEGKWADALPLMQRALEIRTRIHGELHPTVAASRREVGVLLFYLGRYVEAEPLLLGSIAIYDSLPGNHSRQIVDGLNNLSELSRIQDKYADAVAYSVRGLALAEAQLGSDDLVAGVLRNNLAGLYKDLGRYDDAEPLSVAYLDQLRRAPQPDPELLATAQLNLAEIYRFQDRLDEAEPLYEQALTLARQVLPAESPDLVPFVNQAAVVYHALGHADRAEPLYRESLARAERSLGLDHPLVAQSLHDLGVLLIDRGRFGEAADTLGRALAIRTRVLGDAHPEAAATRVELARCASLDPARGDTAAAPLLDRAIAALDPAGADPAARLDAHALRARLRARAGRSDEAIVDMEVALALVDTLRASHGGGDQSRGSFMASHLDLYHAMVTWRLARGDLAGALEAHERARARILLDQLSAGAVNLRAGIAPDVLAPLERKERDARQRLAQAQRRIGDARSRSDLSESARLESVAALEAGRDSAAWDLRRVQETIKERSPLWRELLGAGGHTASLAEIQRQLLAPGELMLLFHTGVDGSYLFVIPVDGKPGAFSLAIDSAAARELRVPPGPLTARTLERIMAGEPGRPAAGSAAPIAALLAMRGEDQRTLVSERVAGQPGLLERRLAALARVLLPGAVWSQVAKTRAVVVVPDGALHLLPFEALVMRTGTGRGDVRFWLDEGPPVRYGSSATSLLSLTRRATTGVNGSVRPRLLSVSNPDYAPAGSAATSGGTRGAVPRWPALPGTARETEAIRRAFAPESIAIVSGPAATEARVRTALPGRRFLHFATHGFVTERQSDVLAGLVLTPPDSSSVRSDDDGYLQLYEIYELRLASDLAVLSACGTQQGSRVAGEGVFALSRGFLTAGAKRVIASLWEVSDASTAELMGRFFAALAGPARTGGDPAYSALLRDAKRRLRADSRWADPFYWAPFILTGPR